VIAHHRSRLPEGKLSSSVENLVDSLSLRLWGLVAVKVEARMVVELAAVRGELLDEAQKHRELGTDLGQIVADGLEAASEKITRDWMTIEALSTRPVGGRKDGHRDATNSIHAARSQSDEKRSRGRPRKNSLPLLGDSEQESASISSGAPSKELVP
jgi:hypothetical protein